MSEGITETGATDHNDEKSNGDGPNMMQENNSTDDEAVLGKRPRASPSMGDTTDGATKGTKTPAKKAKVDDSAKAELRRMLEEKKRMLAEVEKELSLLKSPSLSASTIGVPGLATPLATQQSVSAPSTPVLSSSAPAIPTIPQSTGSRGRARGAASTSTAGKRKAAGSASIPRHASTDATPTTAAASPSAGSNSKEATTPANDSVATRAKRARRPKRLDTYGSPVTLSWPLRQCQALLKTLMTHRFGWPFNQPVDPIALNIPDYFDVIKHPMDLGTIKEQLESDHYESEDQFAEDVRLVWSNAFTYNQPGSDICIMASTLSGIFNEKFEILKSKIAEKGLGAPVGSVEQTIKELRNSVTSVQRELERIKKTPNGRSRPASAREEDARPMTFEEKKKLSHAINNLPSENLGMVVKIIHERMPHLTASGEEIEIDIDALNPITLRHLERYVRSVTQKNRRRASRSTSLTASAKNVQSENLQPQGTQKKIEDVERQIKALEEKNKALTQKGLSRSVGEGDLRLGEEKRKKKDEDSESSESEVSGSDSESSDSETSESESDSGSDSESTDSEAEKKETQPAATTTTTASSAPAPTSSESSVASSGIADGNAASAIPSPAVPATTNEHGEANGHQGKGAGSAISFSFDPTLVKDAALPAEAGNGEENLPQAASAAGDAPPKPETPKSVALKNVDAWSELSDDFDASTAAAAATADKPQSPPSHDKTWSQFQTKRMLEAMREKEKFEKEERERKERERREEEKRQEEERRRRELAEAEERRRREAEEAELATQRERERQRQAERLAREKGMNMMEQSMLIASLEQQAAPAMPIFQYKQLDDEADLDELDAPRAAGEPASSKQDEHKVLNDNGAVEGVETDGSEMEEGQI